MVNMQKLVAFMCNVNMYFMYNNIYVTLYKYAIHIVDTERRTMTKTKYFFWQTFECLLGVGCSARYFSCKDVICVAPAMKGQSDENTPVQKMTIQYENGCETFKWEMLSIEKGSMKAVWDTDVIVSVVSLWTERLKSWPPCTCDVTLLRKRALQM